MEATSRSLSMLRAADAMLHALGGAEITLRLPGPPATSNPRAGLAPPPSEDVAVGPAVVRRYPDNEGRRRLEVLISGRALRAVAAQRNADTPEQLLETALGVVFNDAFLHIERVDADIFAATAYLYRVIVFSFPQGSAS